MVPSWKRQKIRPLCRPCGTPATDRYGPWSWACTWPTNNFALLRCGYMYGYKHCSLIPLLVSNNNFALLRCGYMCTGMLVHIPRHLGMMSNNNKRCQLIVRCMFCNSSRIDLVYDEVRYMVYRWGFPFLDYFFDVLISWSCKLGLYRWFCRIRFHRVLLRIFGFMIMIIIILLYMFISCLITCVLFHQSPILIMLYHICSLLDIAYYLSACSCMPMLTTRFSIHALLIWIYRYTCAYPCTPLGIHHTTRREVSHFSGSSCPDPEMCGFSRLLIRDTQL